ncbi:thioredoxin family protein [Ilumatobacter coccineus]|uniref:Thioredoxin domain-containing protein n=1 Tax=Ilumatobacter coccineus (strain NBRC 103263 / KCTC 29153 / YM16-304) TaxID=1313172 RepID=A0A6C7EEX1_ILUCY|nr:thioredoxin family protein [Ilumatobacter coccineus]BAN03168.1 hypothetical protein YM304_28540 [Ilumatobacter coccineus YM16-304]
MTRLLIAVVIILLAAAVAEVVKRRRVPDAPTQQRFNVPEQLDRADFVRPDAPWLVVTFSSDTCDKCAEVVSKAAVLETNEVAVANIDFLAQRELHERYRIDAVPTLVIVDAAGVTRKSFLGPMTATDLWAAVAEVREPGSTPDGCGNHAPS